MNNIYLDRKITDEERRKLVLDGSIFVYSSTPGSIALCDHAKKMINDAFNHHDPQKAQFSMKVEEFISIIGELKPKFTNNDHTKVLLKKLLEEYGYDLDKTYFDVPRLRIVTHGGYLSSGVGYAYKPHRDTWYSNPHCQIAWWMPVYPLEPGQALSFYLGYWNRPIKNSSNEFDYDEWRKVGRALATNQGKEDTRKHPLPLEEIDKKDEIRIITSSAQPIIFSSAHLHATSTNDSNLTRFSIDFKIVNHDDLVSNVGAHNIDCSARGTTLIDYVKASDFSPIPPEIIC